MVDWWWFVHDVVSASPSVITGLLVDVTSSSTQVHHINITHTVLTFTFYWLTVSRDVRGSRQHITGHFRDDSFQSVTCTGTDNLTRTTNRQNTLITQNNNAQHIHQKT